MRAVVICEPVRTAVGRYGGAFRSVSASDLAVAVIRGVLERTGLDPGLIQDVVLGHCNPTADAPAIGRMAALDAGLPVTVPGLQVDRRCGSGLQAVIYAAMQVQTGVADLVLAGGTESMSGASHYATGARWGNQGPITYEDTLSRARVTAGGRNFPLPGGMIETAENLRRRFHIARQAQDELALQSHQRAVAAQRSALFKDEIVPITITGRHGETLVDTDEHPRADASLESLARLPPILRSRDPEATVTAGNASGQNDGAAVCIVTHREMAEQHGLRPMIRLVAWAVSGTDPTTMGIGPVTATELALARAGLSLADIDIIELNEAFAVQVLAVTTLWGLGVDDMDRVNVRGSAISLGHPLGATGARILATLAREVHRRDARYALETMCIGGGQGIAAVWERID